MKKILIFLLVLAFTVMAVSCGKCKNHTDENGDGICDKCEAELIKQPCAECVDGNGDEVCDVCGGNVEPDVQRVPSEIELPRDEFN